MSTLPPASASTPAPPAGTDHDALPPGTRFGEFEILRVLGVGGFGIVYLANDHSLEREVALKEYMPASLAARGLGPQITVRSSSFAETYAIGLRSFINEARLLARFDHPSLVKVYRFWEDNATAYMVMPFLQGVTLRDTRRRMTHPPDEAWIRSVISPILAALELLHREGVYHRDIAPDNILLPPDGPPVLLDFGAARRVISDRTQSLTAILKPSYAPIEQYAEMTQLRQGPWTDLYALGAVIHYLLFGVPPAPATARAVQDDAEAIENRIVPGVSPRFLEAVSWMLSIRPNQRPQNGEQLRAVLDGTAQIPPRGLPGITIPPNSPVAAGLVPLARPPGEAPSDPTFVATAHIPTHLPTAHLPPPGSSRPAPTTFSPTAQMPTARTATQPALPDLPWTGGAAGAPPVTVAPPASRTALPRSEAAASQWPASQQPALTPPPPPAPPPRPPVPLAAQPPGGPRAAPPVTPAAGPAPIPVGRSTSSGGSKAWVILAGVIGVAAIAGVAAWQFGAQRDPGGTAAALGAASGPALAAPAPAVPAPLPPPTATAPAGPPAVAVPAPATPDPAPTAAALPAATVPATTMPAPPLSGTAVPAAIARNLPPATATATLPPAGRSVPAPFSRPAPAAARADAHADPDARSPVSGRATLAGERSASADRASLAASTSAGLQQRPRPLGMPLPRPRDPETSATGTTTSPGGYPARPTEPSTGYVNPYGAPPANNSGAPNDRPRPLGQSNVREPVASARPVPGPVPAPAQQVDAGPTSAREACGKRVFIALALCMEEKCQEGRFRNSSECVAVNERKRARDNR
ncbi:MAG: protein kinase [Caldimonas sp.]